MKSNQGSLSVGLAVGLLILGVIGSIGVGYVEYKKRNTESLALQQTSVLVFPNDSHIDYVNKLVAEPTSKPLSQETKKGNLAPVVINNEVKVPSANMSFLSGDNLLPVLLLLSDGFKENNLDIINKYSYEEINSKDWADIPMELKTNYSRVYLDLSQSAIMTKWHDDKQAIYQTEYKKGIPKDGFITYQTQNIFFVKTKDDNWRLILGPDRSVTFGLNEDPVKVLADSDWDGLLDSYENQCNTLPGSLKCEPKVDANKRDTDGDGWWDGVDAEL